jgi:hypothetical protein
VAEGAFAPGHLGELTRFVPFEMVDAVQSGIRGHLWHQILRDRQPATTSPRSQGR